MRDLDVGQLGILVDDRDPQALFDAMVAAVQTRNPDWIPHNAALEVQLLEAFAIAGADWIYATNRTMGALVETVLTLFGVPRDPGAPGTGQITLTFDGTPDTSIPAGTEFLTGDGTTLLAATLTPATSTTVTVAVEEAEPGTAGILPAGTPLSPAAGIPRLSTCQLTTTVTGSRPAEDDRAWLTRAAARLRRVTTSLAVPGDFIAAALEDPRVGRATAINRWNPTTSAYADGHITVALYGRGAALDTPTLTSIATALDEASLSILTVHTIPAVLVPVTVTAGITVADGYDASDTIAAATAALRAWLGWDNAGFGQTITPTALEAVLANVPGVSTPLVTAPTGDVTTGLWQIPSPGTITINV